MHYENGQIIYYLRTSPWGHQRVLQLQVKIATPTCATTRTKCIILNEDWDKDRYGAFMWLDDLDAAFVATSPIEPISELYRRNVAEVSKAIEPLLNKTMNEYNIPSNARNTTKATD